MKGQVWKVLNNICLYSIITGGDISLVQFMKANLVEHFDNKRGEVNFVVVKSSYAIQYQDIFPIVKSQGLSRSILLASLLT